MTPPFKPPGLKLLKFRISLTLVHHKSNESIICQPGTKVAITFFGGFLENLKFPKDILKLSDLYPTLNVTLKCFFFFFKFTFIFIYNSYGLIVEEFFARFCSRTIFLLWLLFGCTFMILPGKKGINYYMCTGENPTNDIYSTQKVRVLINKKKSINFNKTLIIFQKLL